MEQILGAHPIEDTFWENYYPTDVSIDTVYSEEQMTGNHITKFQTPEDKEIIPEDLLSQVSQHFDNRHNWQLMTPKHYADHKHHNPRDLTSNPSVDGKLIIHKDESIPSVAM